MAVVILSGLGTGTVLLEVLTIDYAHCISALSYDARALKARWRRWRRCKRVGSFRDAEAATGEHTANPSVPKARADSHCCPKASAALAMIRSACPAGAARQRFFVYQRRVYTADFTERLAVVDTALSRKGRHRAYQQFPEGQ